MEGFRRMDWPWLTVASAPTNGVDNDNDMRRLAMAMPASLPVIVMNSIGPHDPPSVSFQLPPYNNHPFNNQAPTLNLSYERYYLDMDLNNPHPLNFIPMPFPPPPYPRFVNPPVDAQAINPDNDVLITEMVYRTTVPLDADAGAEGFHQNVELEDGVQDVMWGSLNSHPQDPFSEELIIPDYLDMARVDYPNDDILYMAPNNNANAVPPQNVLNINNNANNAKAPDFLDLDAASNNIPAPNNNNNSPPPDSPKEAENFDDDDEESGRESPLERIMNRFPCSHCAKSSTTRSMLRRHEKIHKGDFHCQIFGCKALYGNQTSLTKHMQDEHGLKPKRLRKPPKPPVVVKVEDDDDEEWY